MENNCKLIEQIERNFVYHSPKNSQPQKYKTLREIARELALLIADLVPTSREQSLAIIKLEETIFWANAGIAREE